MLAIVAAIEIDKRITDTGVLVFSLLFPAMNFIFALSRMAWFALGGSRIDMTATTGLPQPEYMEETYHTAVYLFWVFLVIQIFVYPLLAILVERVIHGISFKGRTLSENPAAEDAWVAVRTSQLRKVYRPSIWRKIFCCAGKSKNVTAVDGLDLVAQKNQILCLLGVNGSGKTKTLDLIGGTQTSTAGEVVINAPSTKLGRASVFHVRRRNGYIY